jgi:hypothetical protein
MAIKEPSLQEAMGVEPTRGNLPPVAYLDNRDRSRADHDAGTIGVVRGHSGFSPMYGDWSADVLNAKTGVTKAQAEAMYAGAMFGWHVPAANPDNYDENGKLLNTPPAG